MVSFIGNNIRPKGIGLIPSRKTIEGGYKTIIGNGSGLFQETLSDSALVYTRDCPDTIFYNDSTRNFSLNEPAYVIYKGHKLYQIQGASEQLIGHDMDGSHDEWLPFQLTFDSNINPQKWIATAVSNLHFNRYAITIDGSSYYTYSCLVKAGELYKFRITFQGTGFVGSPTGEFNLSTGAIITETGCSAWIIPCGDDKYYCSISAKSDTIGSYYCQPALIDNDGNTTFTGDGTSGIYWYGCKAEKSAFPSSYHRGGVNLLEYSQDFEDAVWSLSSNCTLTANTVIDPNGYSASTIMEQDVVGGNFYIRQSITPDGSSDYNASFYVKSNGTKIIRIAYYGSATKFDITDGTYTGDTPCTISDEGDGWYRISKTRPSTDVNPINIGIDLCDDDGNITHDGDSSKGIHISESQCELNTDEPSEYEYTTDSANFGIRVATNAYWPEADVKDWVWTGKWKFYFIPNYDSATMVPVSGSNSMFFNPTISATAYIRYSSVEKFEIRDIATGLCVQSDTITCDRGDIFEIQVDYDNAQLTIIKNGTTFGPYTGVQWVWSGDLYMYHVAGIYVEGFLSKPIRM